MARTLRWTLLMALFALPLSAGAQQSSGSVATTATLGPRASETRVGVAIEGGLDARTERTPTLPAQGSRRGRTLMIVGGAALVGGIIVGDDAGTIIMIGGLAVGLYGLYLYLQ